MPGLLFREPLLDMAINLITHFTELLQHFLTRALKNRGIFQIPMRVDSGF